MARICWVTCLTLVSVSLHFTSLGGLCHAVPSCGLWFDYRVLCRTVQPSVALRAGACPECGRHLVGLLSAWDCDSFISPEDYEKLRARDTKAPFPLLPCMAVRVRVHQAYTLLTVPAVSQRRVLGLPKKEACGRGGLAEAQQQAVSWPWGLSVGWVQSRGPSQPGWMSIEELQQSRK